ncbi:MAG: ATP-binding cassette domain-containing protein, partial [Ilumatobacteraceae bacterium]
MSLAITIRRALGERRLEVDLEIADGERLVVIGPNGAGKSSLLRSVAGLDPIDSGRVTFGDEIWDDAATSEHRPVESRRLGLVPQRDALLA